jgi:hypothetical protein
MIVGRNRRRAVAGGSAPALRVGASGSVSAFRVVASRFAPALRAVASRSAALIAILAGLATLPAASSALATQHHPTGIFVPFADCPLSNPTVEKCVVIKSTGEFTAGNRTVPLTNPITLQGGTFENPTTEETTFVGAEDGNTLSRTPETVPGGLAEFAALPPLPKRVRKSIERLIARFNTVTATIELAAPASSIGVSIRNLFFEEGPVLTLPVKIKLTNPLLGDRCYVGSDRDPVVLEFTVGTTTPPPPNTPITGRPGEIRVVEGGLLAVLENNVLVNNSFAAPEAHDCGRIGPLPATPLLNHALGLPSAAGHNTAILDASLEEVTALAARESE